MSRETTPPENATPGEIANADQRWMAAREIVHKLILEYTGFRIAQPEAHPLALPSTIVEYTHQLDAEALELLVFGFLHEMNLIAVAALELRQHLKAFGVSDAEA